MDPSEQPWLLTPEEKQKQIEYNQFSAAIVGILSQDYCYKIKEQKVVALMQGRIKPCNKEGCECVEEKKTLYEWVIIKEMVNHADFSVEKTSKRIMDLLFA